MLSRGLFRRVSVSCLASTLCLSARPIKSHKQVKRNGFTLLELLVVLAIMGALLSVTSVFYRTDDNKELHFQTSQALRLFLQHKIDQTWLDGITYGLQVTPNKIEVYTLELSDNSWQETSYAWEPTEEEIQVRFINSPTDEEAEANTSSDNSISIDSINEVTTYETTKVEIKAEPEKMDIVLMSSGEYTPFTIYIESTNTETQQTQFTLKGDGVNALQTTEEE